MGLLSAFVGQLYIRGMSSLNQRLMGTASYLAEAVLRGYSVAALAMLPCLISKLLPMNWNVVMKIVYHILLLY